MGTYETMVERLKSPASRVPGSFAMDNLAAVAVELDKLWEMGVNFMPNRFFPLLAWGDDLTRAAANFGIERKPSRKARVTLRFFGDVGTVIEKGTGASAGNIMFFTQRAAEIGAPGYVDVSAECVREGSVGNMFKETINTLVSAQVGLKSVTNPQASSGGADGESDSDLLLRVRARWENPSTGGNRADYVRWALGVPGVSRVRVFNPSAGWVHIYIVGDGATPAGEQLLSDVQNAIQEVRPLGAGVVVFSAIPVHIIVTVSAIIEEGCLASEIRDIISGQISAYFAQIAFATDTVSYVRIAELLFVSGIIDISSYSLNGSLSSINLTQVQFPYLAGVVLEVG